MPLACLTAWAVDCYGPLSNFIYESQVAALGPAN